MDLRKFENRAIVIKDIKNPENINRKDQSFKATQIYSGNLKQYVFDYLSKLFSPDSVAEMPIQSGTNICARYVSEKASIYNEAPTRHYMNMSEEQEEVFNKAYDDMQADYLLKKANEFYSLQNQCLIQCSPIDKKLKMRILKMHHFDILPMPNDPTQMLAVIISEYDKDFRRNNRGDNFPQGGSEFGAPHRRNMSDNIDQSIADDDDEGPDYFEVWTREYVDKDGELVPALNFIMDKKGEILSEDPLSPISSLPFINVVGYQDHQFFATETSNVVDFTVEYAALNTEIAQILRQQGFSQAVLIGPQKFLESQREVKVGPNSIINLPVDLDEGSADFQFRTPGGSLSNALEYSQKVLAEFLACHGIDPKVISNESGNRYASGIERLLAMIERFEASKSDYNLFHLVEDKVFHLMHEWFNAAEFTDLLDDKYRMPRLADDIDINVEFRKPEGAQTQREKVEMQERLMDRGLASRVTAAMEIFDLSKEAAEEYIADIDEQKAGNVLGLRNLEQDQEDESGNILEVKSLE